MILQFRQASVVVGCAVVGIAGHSVRGGVPAVCFDVADSAHHRLIVDLGSSVMCLRCTAMLLGGRQMRSASPDMGFFGIATGQSDIGFSDGLACGQLSA